ncbi:MAG: virion core protein, T7 gp14 family [bacterium]
MCIGIGLGAVLSIAQAGVGFIGAMAQYQAQKDYQEQVRLNAIAAANDKYAALQRKSDQEKRSSSEKLFEKRLEGIRKRAQVAQRAVDGGVSGLSVAALEQDFAGQQARREAAINTNFETKKQYYAEELISTYHQAVARINSAPRPVAPNPLAFALQGLGGALKAG